MTDKELLELAAKAAGITHRGKSGMPAQQDDAEGWLVVWNPLTDDGDALRLAVKLKLCVTVRNNDTRTHQYESQSKKRQRHEESGCPYSATRRAIVRAAAEIGAKL